MERFFKWQWLQFSEKTRATAVFYSETAVEKTAVEIQKRQWKKRQRSVLLLSGSEFELIYLPHSIVFSRYESEP